MLTLKLDLKNKDKCIYIVPEKFKMQNMCLHHKCTCNIPKRINKLYNHKIHHLFHSKKNKRIWYIVPKSIVPNIVSNDLLYNIYPCKNFNNKFQLNAFLWIISFDFTNLLKLKHHCDEVFYMIKNKVNRRDHYKTKIIACKKDHKTDNRINKSWNVYYGFTSQCLPRINGLYALGIIQTIHGRKYVNAPGGKKEIVWNDFDKNIKSETIYETAKRETWEEIGLEIDDKLFKQCLSNSQKNKIKAICTTKGGFVGYNLFIPDFSKLDLKMVDRNNPKKTRYLVTCNNT